MKAIHKTILAVMLATGSSLPGAVRAQAPAAPAEAKMEKTAAKRADSWEGSSTQKMGKPLRFKRGVEYVVVSLDGQGKFLSGKPFKASRDFQLPPPKQDQKVMVMEAVYTCPSCNPCMCLGPIPPVRYPPPPPPPGDSPRLKFDDLLQAVDMKLVQDAVVDPGKVNAPGSPPANPLPAGLKQ